MFFIAFGLICSHIGHFCFHFFFLCFWTLPRTGTLPVFGADSAGAPDAPVTMDTSIFWEDARAGKLLASEGWWQNSCILTFSGGQCCSFLSAVLERSKAGLSRITHTAWLFHFLCSLFHSWSVFPGISFPKSYLYWVPISGYASWGNTTLEGLLSLHFWCLKQFIIHLMLHKSWWIS